MFSSPLSFDATSPNKLLQRTFDPLRTLASARLHIASNAAELRRWAAVENSE